MPPQAKTRAEFIERFWARVTRPSDDACWEWQGATACGYGSLRHLKQHYYAHVLSYTLAFGPVPEGMCVCHTCDNRLCCNPRHHFLGTRGDNLQDAATKARMQHGMDRPDAKLTDRDVRNIRAAYAAGGVTQKELAAEYAVAQTVISRVVRRVGWRHVT